MSFALPAGAKVTYPRGIDSSILHMSGEGFQLLADNFGSYSGGGRLQVGRRSAKLTERTAPGCNERVWEVELPLADPALAGCQPSFSLRQCTSSLGHVQISTRCTSAASCESVDTIIDSIQFAQQPWPALPSADGTWKPPAPVCKFPGE